MIIFYFKHKHFGFIFLNTLLCAGWLVCDYEHVCDYHYEHMLIIVSICLCTPWALQLILRHCHPLCICALNIFAIARCSFTFRYSLHHDRLQCSTHNALTTHPAHTSQTHTHIHTPPPTSGTLP